MGSPEPLVRRGCPLSYTVRGAGAPVLLIQGVGVPGIGWTPQVERLAPRYTCLVFDNRGVGASVPCGDGPTVELMAEDALALLDTQGWRSAHVIGHSLGGVIAQQMALVARERVRSLSLLCTFARGADAGRSAKVAWIGLRSRLGTRRMRRHAFLELVLAPNTRRNGDLDAWAERLAPLFGHDLAEQPPIVMRQLEALREYDGTGRLAELAGIPTLVIGAQHDPLSPPRVGRALANAIPGARFVEMAGAAHGVVFESPDQIDALLQAHLAGS